MNLQDILLLGNDMIIPRDIRDWGVYMGSEPQVEKNTLKLNPTKKNLSSGHSCQGHRCAGHERVSDAI